MIAHNYLHVLDTCDRVRLLQAGCITFDRPTAETSVQELLTLVGARPTRDPHHSECSHR